MNNKNEKALILTKMVSLYSERTILKTDNSRMFVIENYDKDHRSVFNHLNSLKYNSERIKFFNYGKKCTMNRDQLFVSDYSDGYNFSGQTVKSIPLKTSEVVEKRLSDVSALFDTDFNAVLINRYENGHDYICAHSDKEENLGTKNNMVVCIGYGATRTMRIKNKSDNKTVLNYNHESGTLLAMEGDFQKEFTHEIPQQKRILDARISLTFRFHKS